MTKAQVSAVLAVTTLVLVAWQQRSGDSPPPHVKWEYKFEKLTFEGLEPGTDRPTNIVNNLNRFGEDGWELAVVEPGEHTVTVTGTGTQRKVAAGLTLNCYFKRPK